LLLAGLTVMGRNFKRYVADYKSGRGMDFHHDVHDWMGGYPYESIAAGDVDQLMRGLRFEHVRSFTRPLSLGFFGSGCDEFVYRGPAGTCSDRVLIAGALFNQVGLVIRASESRCPSRATLRSNAPRG
jgi:hypothetical protein